MKLIKHLPIKIGEEENNFTTSEVMISDDASHLKREADDLCRIMGIEPAAWSSRYPIMGQNPIKPTTEWMMVLDNGIVFSIEN